MDSANKRTAIVAETTMGTTPASPAFKLLRDSAITGSPRREAQRSPERRSDRMAAAMTSGLTSFAKTINLPFARDAGTDILLESLFCAAWGTDVLENASTKRAFTLEETYEGGATDPYRRLTGCLCDSLRLSFPLAAGGAPGTLAFGILALDETTATTALASSSYTAPTPGYDPVSSIDITANDLFGISGAKIIGLDVTIGSSMREKYSFGSPKPWDIGLGLFNVAGQVQFHFEQLSDYSAFVTRQTGLTLDLTIGTEEDYSDRIRIINVDVWNPDVNDPGNSGDHVVTLEFMGRYSAGYSAAIEWVRNYGALSLDFTKVRNSQYIPLI